MKHRNALAIAAAALAFPCLAQAGWYGGFSVGATKADDSIVANRESTIVNGVSSGSDFDARDTGARLFGGYSFTPWFALEMNYAWLGENRLQTGTLTTTPGQPAVAGSFDITRTISGFGVDAVFTAPLGERATIYGRAGAVRSHLEAEVTLGGALVFTSGNPQDRTRKTTRNETVPRFGVGAEYMLTKNTGLRLEYERWFDVGKKFEVGGTGTTGETDVDILSLGLSWRF